jgi:hypothetical protein
MERPHGNTYWLVPGLLLAGEHPGASPEHDVEARLRATLACGIREFVDLTHEHELEPYQAALARLAAAAGCDTRYRRFPIVDMDVPESPSLMRRILDHLDAAVDAGRPAYVHCWGGIGRTGTVMGCFMVRHGVGGEDALRELNALWPAMAKSWYYRRTPQTDVQHDYVRGWPRRT